jgi:hypothetical protein
MAITWASHQPSAQATDEELGKVAHVDPMYLRKSLFKKGAPLMVLLTAGVALTSVWKHQHTNVRKLSSAPGKLSAHNASEHMIEQNKTRDKQQGIERPPLPVYPVSAMQMCNYEHDRVYPGFAQAYGTPGYWTISGTWVPINKCYTFDSALIASHAVEGAPMECSYARESDQWNLGSNQQVPHFRSCSGANPVYNRNSKYASMYSCVGSPVTCSYNGVFVYRRR